VRPCIRAHHKVGEWGFLMGKKTESEALIERNCAHCEFGTVIALPAKEDPDIICEKHGIVRRDHVCRHFRYDLLKRDPKKAAEEPNEASEY